MKIDPKILELLTHEKIILKRLLPNQDLETEFTISKDQIQAFISEGQERPWRLFKVAYENKVTDIDASKVVRSRPTSKKTKKVNEAPSETLPATST